MTEIVSVIGDDFTGAATYDEFAIQALLKGNADNAALDALEMLLNRIHAEACRRVVTETVIDLRELVFMSSSCFKSMVSWIANIQELDAAKQYKVRFISNPNMPWQKRSLHSLRGCAVELITVTETVTETVIEQ